MQQNHQCRNNSLVLLTKAPIGAWKCNFSLFERETKQPLTYQLTDGHEGSWESYTSYKRNLFSMFNDIQQF